MTDPFEALRLPVVPTAPNSRFAATLRQQLERVVDPGEPPRPATATHARPTNQGAGVMTSLPQHPHRSFNGTRNGDVSKLTMAVPDAEAGRRFYGHVLGWSFTPDGRTTAGERAEAVVPEIELWPAAAWSEAITAGAILTWRVDELGPALDAVRQAGGTTGNLVELASGRRADCSDGQGLRFWLHELPAAAHEPADANGEQEGDVSYLVLRVATLERARNFFSLVLGWQFTPAPSGLTVVGCSPMTGMSEGAPGVVACFRVVDVAAATARALAAGGHAGPIERRPYGLEALCQDDQGLSFYLHQLT